MWKNDIKCKYMFMFSLNNLAHKGLNLKYMPHKSSELWGVSESMLEKIYLDNAGPTFRGISQHLIYIYI